MTTQQIETIKKSAWKRFWSKTPKFFRKLQKASAILGGMLGGLSTYILTNKPESRLGIILATISGVCITVLPLILNFAIDVEHLINEDEDDSK